MNNVLKNCKHCGKRFRSNNLVYCSDECKQRVGRKIDEGHGYVLIRVPDGTPGARLKGQWMLEHRWVMQQHLGRTLTSEENVHHRNGDKTDNRIENLELWSSSHPPGQRIEDLVAYAQEILERYEVTYLIRPQGKALLKDASR